MLVLFALIALSYLYPSSFLILLRKVLTTYPVFRLIRYQSLSLQLIAPDNWVSLKGTASTAAKVTAPPGAKNNSSNSPGSDSTSPKKGGSSSSGGERVHFLLAAGQTEAATREEQVRLKAWADALRSQQGQPNDHHHHNNLQTTAAPPPGSDVASPTAKSQPPPTGKGYDAPKSTPFFPPILQAPGASHNNNTPPKKKEKEKGSAKSKGDNAKEGDASSSENDSDDDEGPAPPGKPKVERLAMRKGTMNYMTRHAFSLRSQYGAGWLKRDSDPWRVL